MKDETRAEMERLVADYPKLQSIHKEIEETFLRLAECVSQEGIIFLCGNGGSAADCEHIVGELMKGYKLRREISDEEKQSFQDGYGERGLAIAGSLQRVIRAISLTSQTSLMTAYINDVNSENVYAQQIYGYGRAADVLWILSTSGNSPNVVNGAIAAKERGVCVVAMTGAGGGELGGIADICLRVPFTETDRIQESHITVYHCLCAMLEKEFF